MSTPPPNGTGSGADEQPRYGRRAQDEPGYVPPAQGTPGDSAGFSSGLGASSAGHDSIPSDPYAGAAGTGMGNPSSVNGTAPGYGQAAGYQMSAPGYGPAAGYQASAPGYGPAAGYQASAPGYGPGPAMPPGGTPNLSLPGRGGAIAMIIGGLLAMLLIAPIVFLSVAGYSLSSKVDSDFTEGTTVNVVNGTDVEVVGGFFGVVIVPPADGITCQLSGSGGTFDIPEKKSTDNQSSSLFMAEGLDDGTYRLTCSNVPEGSSAMLIDANLLGGVAGGFGIGFLAGSVVGLIGFILLIWGIVRLVRTNRRRREIQMNAMMGY